MECALAVTLLVGAGLLMRSLLLVRSVNAGFDTTRFWWPGSIFRFRPRREWRRQEWETFAEITRRLEALPGVRSAGAITNLMTFDHPEEAITVEDRPFVADRTNSILINTEDVTPEFFRAMGVPF